MLLCRMHSRFFVWLGWYLRLSNLFSPMGGRVTAYIWYFGVTLFRAGLGFDTQACVGSTLAVAKYRYLVVTVKQINWAQY